jgi:hypothetical protein
MAWTTPKTWVADATLPASDLNTHVRDNLDALKSPPSDHHELNEVADITTSSTTFVDVDGTNYEFSITTYGGDLLVGFHGTVNESGGNQQVHFNIAVDGVDVAADDGLYSCYGLRQGVGFVYKLTSIDADTHTFTLRWKVQTGGAATLYAGAGTADLDIHPQFWAIEIG